MAALAATLVAASAAWACTILKSDGLKINGATSATVSAGGTVPSVTADNFSGTSPSNGSSWNMVATKTDRGRYCMTYTDTLYTGAIMNRANTPDLGPVNGTAPTALGTYDVCFITGSYSMIPAVLTVN